MENLEGQCPTRRQWTGNQPPGRCGGQAALLCLAATAQPPKLLVMIPWKLVGLHVNCLVHPIIKMIGPAAGRGAACWLERPPKPGSALWFGVPACTLDSRNRGPRGPGSRSLASDGINEARAASDAGTLWSFTALCLQRALVFHCWLPPCLWG